VLHIVLDNFSLGLLASDVLDRGAEATSSYAAISETLRRLERKGCIVVYSAEVVAGSSLRDGWGARLTPAHCHPLKNGWSAIGKEAGSVHSPLFFSSLPSFSPEDQGCGSSLPASIGLVAPKVENLEKIRGVLQATGLLRRVHASAGN
jgi:hypothetical protein